MFNIWFYKTRQVHTGHRMQQSLLRSFAVVGLVSLFVGHGCFAAGAPRWVASWMAAPCAPAPAEPRSGDFQMQDETVREIVHLSIGGLGVRLRFGNTFGSQPLVLRSVHVAERIHADVIDPSTDMPVTFSGATAVTIAPGKSVFSDPVNLAVRPSADIAISYYVPDKATAGAIHYTALQTSYVVHGEKSIVPDFGKAARPITLHLVLTGVDVATRNAPGAIVAIGSSTTDGAHSSMNKNRRWTDDLYARIAAMAGDNSPSVLNAGISGNRVLHDGLGSWGPVWGVSGVARFQRDVLEQTGVNAVIMFEGGNDVREGGAEAINAQQLIAGFELLARTAHQRGLKFVAGTITPFEGSGNNGEGNPGPEITRLAFNKWVRSTKEIDGVADFDAAIGDPKHPARLQAAYDSGDHLHPNDAGYQAMADSINLSLFSINAGAQPAGTP
jgi:lysophospholipase L1-like esterase